jgi:hypothetical protein
MATIMDDQRNDNPPRKDVSPAMRAFLQADATGQSKTDDVPLPSRLVKFRKKWQSLLGRQSQTEQPESNPVNEQGPERFIGPRNPEHPDVNRTNGGRDPA